MMGSETFSRLCSVFIRILCFKLEIVCIFIGWSLFSGNSDLELEIPASLVENSQKNQISLKSGFFEHCVFQAKTSCMKVGIL